MSRLSRLEIVNSDSLTVEQRRSIDNQITRIIQQHENNRAEINRMTFDCVTSLAAGRSRSEELASQGFFSRLWGGITGNNQRLQGEINKNFEAAQYASQTCLQKLAEQNLMTFELVTALNNKLNSFAVSVNTDFNNVNKEINKVYDITLEGFKGVRSALNNVNHELDSVYDALNSFLKETRSDIVKLEDRVDYLEQHMKLIIWKSSVEYQTFAGVEYEDMSTVGKIVCITKDFYEITKGKWTTADLLLLKSAFSELNLPPKNKITYLEFLNGLIAEPKFLYGLIAGIDLNNTSAIYTMILEAVKRYHIIEKSINDNHDLVMQKMKDMDSQKIKTALVEKYIFDTSMSSMNAQIPIYEFCVELLYNFEQTQNYLK